MKRTVALFGLCLMMVPSSYAATPNSNASVEDAKYLEQAIALKHLLVSKHIVANTRVIVKTLKAIDRNLPKFFPNGPFTRNDFIALAWLESGFTQYEEGTRGDRGLFQIMPDEFVSCHVKKNFYDIDINTKMAFRVLNGAQKIAAD